MDTKSNIIENVIKEAKTTSLSKISTIKVAKNSKTSESNIYKIFKTKNNLLVSAFLYIDEKVGNYIKCKVPKESNIETQYIIEFSKKVWSTYLEFFVKNPLYATYYSLFRMSSYYNDEIALRQKEHFGNLDDMFITISQGFDVYSQVSFNLFWSFILDSTLLIAKRMGNKEVEYNSENVEVSYHLIFDGLINILFTKAIVK